MTAHALIQSLKADGEDFEFYPTTDEIIAAMLADFAKFRSEKWGHDYRRGEWRSTAILDIGAGHGKVLDAFKAAGIGDELYAIEKSTALCGRLVRRGVFVLGTDFHEQSLVGKEAGITFCNPPYSEFLEWMVRIIRESSSRVVYFVVPRRWADSDAVRLALEYRNAPAEIVGEFDFLEAEDRAARAKVHLLRVALAPEPDDAFNRFFAAQFGHLAGKLASEREPTDGPKTTKRGEMGALVLGEDYPTRLVALYNEEMDHVRANYAKLAELDGGLLKELGVSLDQIRKGLMVRLRGLRTVYWRELFSRMKSITNRLTSKRRTAILDKLAASTNVDFTVGNIHAILLWVMERANDNVQDQLLEVFDHMVDEANVKNYKSNQRPFVYDRWRYNQEKPTHIALEYRIVVSRGGLRKTYHGCELDATAGAFLGDLLTVAFCLGFNTDTSDARTGQYCRHPWSPGEKEEFFYSANSVAKPLFEVRAFLNGNLHIRLAQDFAQALNVEVGRLRGWVANGQEAAEEMGVAPAVAQRVYNSLHTFKPGALLLVA